MQIALTKYLNTPEATQCAAELILIREYKTEMNNQNVSYLIVHKVPYPLTK